MTITEKIIELTQTAAWFKAQGELHLAAALMAVTAVAQTRDPNDLIILVHLLDNFIRDLISHKFGGVDLAELPPASTAYH